MNVKLTPEKILVRVTLFQSLTLNSLIQVALGWKLTQFTVENHML